MAFLYTQETVWGIIGIVIAGLIFLSAVAWLIDFLIRQVVKIAALAGSILRKLRGVFVRCRNDHKRRWQRLRLWWAPIRQHLPNAAIYFFWVLAVSICAPILFLAAGHALRSTLHTPFSTAAASTMVAAVAGFTTALAVSATRGARTKLAEDVTTALAGKVATNYGVDADLIYFEPDRPFHHSGQPDVYQYTHDGSKFASEWMICLRQRTCDAQGRYTIESLTAQLDAFEQWHAQATLMLSDINKCLTVPARDWVCFISNKGRFCAFQSYKVFCQQLRERRNANYLTILNHTDEQAMWTEIDKSMQHARPQTTPGEAVHYPDAIPGLTSFWIVKGTTREDGLRQMIDEEKAHAMLVRELNEGAPLGVISLKTLADQVLYDNLPKPLSPSARPIVCGSKPPGLVLRT